MNSWPASSKISLSSSAIRSAIPSPISARRFGVELDAGALHRGEHLDQRHLDLVAARARARTRSMLLALAGGQLERRGAPRSAGSPAGSPSRRAASCSLRASSAPPSRLPRPRRARRRPPAREVVDAPRRVDQVGGDHRVVLQVQAAGAATASSPVRPPPPCDLASWRRSAVRPRAARPARPGPMRRRRPPVAVAGRPTSLGDRHAPPAPPARSAGVPSSASTTRVSSTARSGTSSKNSSSRRCITARSSNSAATSRRRLRSGGRRASLRTSIGTSMS